MWSDESVSHFGNLSKYERLQFLSGKEKVVAFFTGTKHLNPNKQRNFGIGLNLFLLQNMGDGLI